MRPAASPAVPPSATSSPSSSSSPLFNSHSHSHPYFHSQPRSTMSFTHFPGSPYLSATPVSAVVSLPTPLSSTVSSPMSYPAPSLDDRSVALLIRILNLSLPGVVAASTVALLQPMPLPPGLLAPSPLASPPPYSTPHSTPSPPLPASSSPSPSPDSLPPTEEKDDREKEKDRERESTPYKPATFLFDFLASHGRPFGAGDVSWSSMSCIVMERMQEKRGYHYLHGCYLRLMAERDRLTAAGGTSSTTSAATLQLLSESQTFLVQHTTLLLQRPELLPDKLPAMPRQLVSFLLSHCDRPASSLLPLLSSVIDSLPSSIQLHALSHSLFTLLAHDMRDMTFIHADHFKPPTVLAHLLSLPKLAASFASLPTFIYPFFNGYKIETDSLLGIFLRLTTLPDEPSVGEKFFTQPLHMTDVERLFCMGRLNRKLDKVQEVLSDAWKAMLDEKGEARSGLLTWVAVMLLANWGRTRMRSARKTTSNDGFLLGVAAIMLRVGEKMQLWDRGGGRGLEWIDAFYCLLNSRLDMREETKICATTHDEQAWLSEFWAQVPGGETGRAIGGGSERKESRSDSMDRGEEVKEEKEEKQPLITQMELTYPHHSVSLSTSSLPSSTGDPLTPPASTSPPLQTTSLEPRTSKFKRAKLSLNGLRSQPAQRSPHPLPPVSSSSPQSSSSPLSHSPNALTHSPDSSLSTIPPAVFPTSDVSSTASISPSSSSPLDVGDVRFSSVVDRQYFLSSSSSTHYGIVCDKCRLRDIEGTRYKCFPERDTRILTDRGFVWLKEVEAREAAGEKALYACYDVASGGLVYRHGELVVLDEAPSRLVVIEDEAQQVSLRVTHDHRMYVQVSETDEAGKVKWRTNEPVVMPASSLLCGCVSASDIPCLHRRSTIRMLACAEAGYIAAGDGVSNGCVRLRCPLGFNDSQLSAFLPLCGYWLQNGSLSGRTVAFGFSLPCEQSWLEEALATCGLCKSDCYVDRRELIVTVDSWYEWFADEMAEIQSARDDVDTATDEGDEHGDLQLEQRLLPCWLLTDLSAAQLRLVISGMHRAQSSNTAPFSLSTCSPLLLDQLMHALVLCGYSPTSSQLASSPLTQTPPTAILPHLPSDGWTVAWSQPNQSSGSSSVCTPHLQQHECVRTEPYDASRDGRIWCVRVEHPDHLIFAQSVRMSDGVLVSQSRPLVVGQCLHCKDFDLCASCERQTYIESLGLSQQTGVTFACPYSHCAQPGLKERTLRDHVHSEHANDISLVACPVCAANGTTHTVLTQPGFDVHLSKEHCDDHDGQSHVLAKINKIIPHTQRKLYQPHEPFELIDIGELVADEEAKADAADSKAVIAERIQRRIVHSVTCGHCSTSPIVGVAYRCLHCPDYWLCSMCEGLGFAHHGHPPAHVLAVHRRALTDGQLQGLQPEPLMYPGAVLGSHGFNLETEWLFLTLHSLRVGMMKTCSRYTSLVQSIESESDARKLDSLMKVKLCVDAQLLHPRLLRDTLALYVYVSRWLASLIDPAHGGASISLPLPTCFDVATEVLMRVDGTVQWMGADDVVRLWKQCGGRPRAGLDVASLAVQGGQHRIVYQRLFAVQPPFVYTSKYSRGSRPVRVSGTASINLLLTPDHRMWVAPVDTGRSGGEVKFTSKRADELVDRTWRIDTAAPLVEQEDLCLEMPCLADLLASAAAHPNERVRQQAQQVSAALGDHLEPSLFPALRFQCRECASMEALLVVLGVCLGGATFAVSHGALVFGESDWQNNSLSLALQQLATTHLEKLPQPDSPTASYSVDDSADEADSCSCHSVLDELHNETELTTDEKKTCDRLRCYNSQLALWLLLQGVMDSEKQGYTLPSWVWRLSSRQAAVVVRTAASPNGLVSASEALAHQLHALAMHAGLSTSLTQHNMTDGSMRYQLAVDAVDDTVCDVNATYDDSVATREQQFWCVTTAAPSHIVLVRRRETIDNTTSASSTSSTASPRCRWQSALVGNCGNIPMEFAALPEYLIEDMADYMLFLSRFSIDTMDSCDVTPLIHLFVALVSSTHYLNNPYLRAKLVEVFCGVAEFPTAHGPGCPSLSAQLTSDPFVCQHLMPSLIRLYVDIEHTGSDSQFYDKFNVRHAIAVLMKFLSDFPPHIARMEEEAGDVDLFVRFTNSIINDMIYLLDEALIKAAQLHDAQANIAASRAAQATFIQVNARRQEQERAAQIARSLRTAAVLATHTVNLLWTLCLHDRSSAILLRPEMIDRITASINTYVMKIAGEKRDSIVVKDSAACSYHHDQWLNVFTDIYLAFRDNATFRLSIVKDNRCFSPADFQRAHDILSEKRLKSPTRLAELHTLVTQLATLAADVQSEWDELGDVPEEFLDPILNTLMEEPVLLPSGVAMDRSVIVRHLLNKRMDPFNRQPLDVKDLKDYPEMKVRIERWKSEMRRKRAEERKERGESEGGAGAVGVGRRASTTGSGVAGGSGSSEVEGKSREEKEREKKREREDEEMGDVSAKNERDKESGKRKMRDDNPHMNDTSTSASSSPLVSSTPPMLSPPAVTRLPAASSLSSSASLSSLSSIPPPPSSPLPLHAFPSASSFLNDGSPWLSSASQSSWQQLSAPSAVSSSSPLTSAATSTLALPPFSFSVQQDASPMLLASTSPSPPPRQMQAMLVLSAPGEVGEDDMEDDRRVMGD